MCYERTTGGMMRETTSTWEFREYISQRVGIKGLVPLISRTTSSSPSNILKLWDSVQFNDLDEATLLAICRARTWYSSSSLSLAGHCLKYICIYFWEAQTHNLDNWLGPSRIGLNQKLLPLFLSTWQLVPHSRSDPSQGFINEPTPFFPGWQGKLIRTCDFKRYEGSCPWVRCSLRQGVSAHHRCWPALSPSESELAAWEAKGRGEKGVWQGGEGVDNNSFYFLLWKRFLFWHIKKNFNTSATPKSQFPQMQLFPAPAFFLAR